MQNSLQLSAAEINMMKEISKVFDKYKNKTRKFGLQLVHSHFPINNDEVLYETHDANSRTLLIRPVKIDKVRDKALATAWQRNKNNKIEISSFCCDSVIQK